MRNIIIKICSVSLLIVFCAASAFASAPNPAQMGDPGGVKSQEISKQLQNGAQTNQKSAPTVPTVVSTPAQPSFGGQPQSGAPNAAQGNIMTTKPGSEDMPPPELGTDGNPLMEGTGGIVAGDGAGQTTDGTTPPDASGAVGSGATQTLDWFNGGNELINTYKNLTVYDVKTGVTWKATYINGANHADIIPASEGDAVLLTNNQITGDYVRRPVVVTINGARYAGSMYAEGHGSTNYCTYFKGVMCIHFTGSMTHGSQKVDADHQAAIQEAMKH